MQSDTPSAESARSDLDINRSEFRAILKLAGYSCREFGEYIKRSHTFVSELGWYDGYIPSRWVRALILCVTPEAFELHLKKIRLPKITRR